MSQAFCREYEEFKAQRNAKRREWFLSAGQEWGVGEPGKSSSSLKAAVGVKRKAHGRSGQQHMAPYASAAHPHQRNPSPIDTFSTPPTTDSDIDAGEGEDDFVESGPVYRRVAAEQELSELDSNESESQAPPSKRQLSGHVSALRAELAGAAKQTAATRPDRPARQRQPHSAEQRHSRRRSVPLSSFDDCTPVDDDIDWSDSEASQSQDRAGSLPVTPQTPTLRSRERSVALSLSSSYSSQRTRSTQRRRSLSSSCDLGNKSLMSSWRDAFIPSGPEADPATATAADTLDCHPSSDSDTKGTKRDGISDFDSPSEDSSDENGQPGGKQPAKAVRPGHGMLGDVPCDDRKGSSWIGAIPTWSDGRDASMSLLGDSVLSPLDEGNSVGRVPPPGRTAKGPTYVRGGLAERLSEILAVRHSHVAALEQQLQAGTLSDAGAIVVDVALLGGSVSGYRWAYCYLVTGSAAQSTPVAREEFSDVGDSTADDARGDGGDRLRPNKLVILPLAVALCRRLSISVGVQLRIFKPWEAFHMKDFCPAVLLSANVCELVSPPVIVKAHEKGQRLARLASKGYCPYHPDLPSCTPTMPVYHNPPHQAARLILSEASQRLLARFKEGVCLSSTQALHSRASESCDGSSSTIASAIEAAGGCGPAVNGGVTVTGRVQLVVKCHSPLLSVPAGVCTLSIGRRSLVDAGRCHIARALTKRGDPESSFMWQFVVQDSTGVCFQVSIPDTNLPMECAQPAHLVGRVATFSDLHLTGRHTLKRSPRAFSLLQCFSACVLPQRDMSQNASQSDWAQGHPLTTSTGTATGSAGGSGSGSNTFFSFETALGKRAAINIVRRDQEESSCSWVRQYPTCCPTSSCSLLTDKMRMTRWSLFGHVIARHIEGSQRLLILLVPSPSLSDGASPASRFAWTACRCSDSVQCPGIGPSCLSHSDGNMLRSSPFCVSVQPSCPLPRLIVLPSSSAVVCMDNVLITQSLSDPPVSQAVADSYTSISVVWPVDDSATAGLTAQAQAGPWAGNGHADDNHHRHADLVHSILSSTACYPVSGAMRPMSYVTISGEVVGVDEATAFAWTVCGSCGADVEETDEGVLTSLYCRQCGSVLDEDKTSTHMQLAVYLQDTAMPSSPMTSSPSPPSRSLLVQLQQKSVVAILPPASESQNAELGYDFSEVMGRSLSNLICFITTVSVNDSGVVVVKAIEVPS